MAAYCSCQDGALDYEYASSTSLHGPGNIINAKRPAHRAIWVVLFLAAFSVAVWQITERFVAYFSYNTVTSMKVEFKDELDFPAVTICNFNNLNVSAIPANFDLADLTLNAGFVLDEATLQECKWRGKRCYADNFTHVFTSYGNCWTFNGDDKKRLKQTIPGSGNGLYLVIDVQQVRVQGSDV
uniref:Uncharacterized protein n=1 Tax=Branchiostoma floridae TaxID=7739 RepID=C3YRN6_BRAFL|eukprot:XP_002600779.1 hypothetical protein BRAFLDRAFT_95065 [Branchiostoma floridae]